VTDGVGVGLEEAVGVGLTVGLELGDGTGDGVSLAVSLGDGDGELPGEPPLSPTTIGVGEADGEAEGDADWLCAGTGFEAAAAGDVCAPAAATWLGETPTPREAACDRADAASRPEWWCMPKDPCSAV